MRRCHSSNRLVTETTELVPASTSNEDSKPDCSVTAEISSHLKERHDKLVEDLEAARTAGDALKQDVIQR